MLDEIMAKLEAVNFDQSQTETNAKLQEIIRKGRNAVAAARTEDNNPAAMRLRVPMFNVKQLNSPKLNPEDKLKKDISKQFEFNPEKKLIKINDLEEDTDLGDPVQEFIINYDDHSPDPQTYSAKMFGVNMKLNLNHNGKPIIDKWQFKDQSLYRRKKGKGGRHK